jgi:hypothetical protein
MALNFPVGGGGGDFTPVPSGSHIAICHIVADLGLQPGSAMYPGDKRKVYLRFEIPSERVSYKLDGREVEGPATISAEFTASMNEKATLRKFIEGWRGRQFSDDEAAKFDVSKLLGMAALISVKETQKGDKTYSNIASASPLIKGMVPPNPENELLLYTSESPDAVFNKLPKRVKEKIQGAVQPRSENQRDEELARQFEERDPFLDGP